MAKYTKFVTHNSETLGGERCDAYSFKDIQSEDVLIEDTKLADHAFVLRVMGHLLGKVLTTIEATTASEKQAKAIKDLIRSHFSEEMTFVGSVMFNQQNVDKMAEESFEGLEDEEIVSVEIDDILGLK